MVSADKPEKARKHFAGRISGTMKKGSVMHSHAYPVAPSKRARHHRTAVRHTRTRALVEWLMGPRGHRRATLYHVGIVFFLFVTALAVAGRPASPDEFGSDPSRPGTVRVVPAPGLVEADLNPEVAAARVLGR